MATPYRLEDAINSFFESNEAATRQQCDDFTISRVGGQVSPVEIQGTFSYTVAAGPGCSRIFQFRTQDSSLNIDLLSLAKEVHPQFVANCQYHGTIGKMSPIHIYEMEKLPGSPYIIARDTSLVQPFDAVFRQRNTVKDLARFFAQSWNKGLQFQPHDAADLLAEFQSKIDLLSQSLPAKYTSNLDKVRKQLSSLFSGTLPFVLTHGDLCEMNILISPHTGDVTGIVDWAEARMLPFGFALWAFENILGYMDPDGWHYYSNRRELEDLFWLTFCGEATNAEVHLPSIRLARMAGLFLRYGFIMNGRAVIGVIDLSDASFFAYLDAFCTDNDRDLAD